MSKLIKKIRSLEMLPYPLPQKSLKSALGFTLAELLISLAILGVIATFTIPKILTAQQNGQNNAKAKEAIAMISEAYQSAKQAGTASSAMTTLQLTPYLNYLALDNTSTLDNRPAAGATNCSLNQCVKLHNGAALRFHSENFGGTSNLNYISVIFDPDGVYTGNSDSLGILLYYNGRVTSRAYAETGSTSSSATIGPLPGSDPTWFSW